MRVLFVQKTLALSEPMGVLYLSGALKRRGHETEIVLTDQESLTEKVRQYDPAVVAFSTHTGLHRYFLEENLRLARSGTKQSRLSVFGGPHPTFNPDMINEEGVDAVCIGEGDEAFPDFVDTLAAGGDLTRIPNWWVKQNGTIHRNQVRPLVADLDSLPLPDRQLIYRHDPFIRDAKVKHFFASRGCPYGCAFCQRPRFNEIYRGKGPRVRRRQPAAVVAEVREAARYYPLQFVHFWDDIFITSLDWLKEFAELYRCEVGLPFQCHVRANLVTEKVSQTLRRAGCHSVQMGIETADEEYRRKRLNKAISTEEIRSACRYLNASGIRIFATNIIGLPGGGLAQDLETLRLNAECRTGYSWVSIFQPYPGTPLGEYAKQGGYFTGDFEDLNFSYHLSSPLNFPKGEKRQIENLHMFFDLGARFPWLMPIIRLLIKLPKNRFFLLLYGIWYGYINSTRIYPHRTGLAEKWHSVVRSFRKEFINRLHKHRPGVRQHRAYPSH